MVQNSRASKKRDRSSSPGTSEASLATSNTGQKRLRRTYYTDNDSHGDAEATPVAGDRGKGKRALLVSPLCGAKLDAFKTEKRAHSPASDETIKRRRFQDSRDDEPTPKPCLAPTVKPQTSVAPPTHQPPRRPHAPRNPRFGILDELTRDNDLTLYLTTEFLPPSTLFTLYTISKHFHFLVNSHMTTYIKRSAMRWARLVSDHPAQEHATRDTWLSDMRRHFPPSPPDTARPSPPPSPSPSSPKPSNPESHPAGPSSAAAFAGPPHDTQLFALFPYACYSPLCLRDPTRAQLLSASHEPIPYNPLNPFATRLVPSLRYLQFLVHRVRTIHSLLRTLTFTHQLRLPLEMPLTLAKLWFLLDTPTNGGRIGLVHNAGYFSDMDLRRATLLFLKLDMLCLHPGGHLGSGTPRAAAGFRALMLAQRSLSVLDRVLRREEARDMFEAVRLYVRWRWGGVPALRGRGFSAFGVPEAEFGTLQLEGWGRRWRRVGFGWAQSGVFAGVAAGPAGRGGFVRGGMVGRGRGSVRGGMAGAGFGRGMGRGGSAFAPSNARGSLRGGSAMGAVLSPGNPHGNHGRGTGRGASVTIPRNPPTTATQPPSTQDPAPSPQPSVAPPATPQRQGANPHTQPHSNLPFITTPTPANNIPTSTTTPARRTHNPPTSTPFTRTNPPPNPHGDLRTQPPHLNSILPPQPMGALPTHAHYAPLAPTGPGWGGGANTALLLRPDQIVLREGIRRGLGMEREYRRFMVYGYVDEDTNKPLARVPVVRRRRRRRAGGDVYRVDLGEAGDEGVVVGGKDREERVGGVKGEEEDREGDENVGPEWFDGEEDNGQEKDGEEGDSEPDESSASGEDLADPDLGGEDDVYDDEGT